MLITDPYECGDSLIQLAKKRGSQDNISVIVVFLKKCIIRPDSVEST